MKKDLFTDELFNLRCDKCKLHYQVDWKKNEFGTACNVCLPAVELKIEEILTGGT